jgi:hypothetical protein
MLTRAQVGVNRTDVLAATTIRIVPTSFAAAALGTGLSETQRQMVSNAIDRSMCIGLSDRFRIVAPDAPADLTVHAVITHVGLTDKMMAGASRVVSVGASVAEKVFVPYPVPIPIPRIPLGLGGLAVEAEARDAGGRQKAGMVWARGADVITSKPKVSTAADAYDLAKAFADDFSKLVVTAASPFNTMPSLPSINRITAMFGGAPRETGCEVFGRGPGVVGMIGDGIGLPPEWTDHGAAVKTPTPRDMR